MTLTGSTNREQEIDGAPLGAAFGAVVDVLPNLILVIDPDGTIACANRALCDLVGYDPDTVVGYSVLDLVHEADAPEVKRAIRGFVQGVEEPVRFQCRLEHVDGSWIYIESMGHSLAAQDDVYAIVLDCYDISERKHAEERLRDSEERYRQLVEQIPAIVYMSSFAEGSTEFYVNPQIEDVLGFSRDEWEQGPRLWLNCLHPKDRMRVIAKVAHCHDTGEPLQSEYRVMTKDGRVIWFRDEAVIVRDPEGRPIGLRGVRLDITERKKAEEALRQRNRALELLNRAGQALGSMLALKDVLSTVLENVRHLLGVAVSSIWLVDVESKELVCEQAAGSAHGDLVGWRLPPEQGLAGWVVQNNESLIVPDATKDPRHGSGAALQLGQEFRSILTVPMRSQGEVIGVLQVLDHKAGRFEQADLILLESLTASASSAIENARLYQRAQQEIAERVRAEEALRQERTNLARRVRERTAELSEANADLARAARLKDEFLAAMSHELRTPLNAILGLSETLEEQVYGELNEKQLRSAIGIRESGQHLLELINDILDVAKIEAGKLELELRWVSVASICRSSMRLIEQMAIKKQLKVSLEIDSAVDTIQADGRRLKQILTNLLTNAVKFTLDRGEIGLSVAGDAESGTVHFVVWDTGIGIARADMDRLFQPFVQLDSKLSRQYEGTGLGLALVRRLTELHGGGIALASTLGKGSRFTVSLPWHRRQSVPAAADWMIGDPKQGVRGAGSGALILVVDDNEINITMTVDYLRAQGFRVVVARNGVEAIHRAREEKPDVILMDIQMPEMDGLEAMKRIRADAAMGVAETPIIALTALVMPGDRERCLAAGADMYLGKPVGLKELNKAILDRL